MGGKRVVAILLVAAAACGKPYAIADDADAGVPLAAGDASSADDGSSLGDGGTSEASEASVEAGGCAIVCDDFESSSFDTTKWELDEGPDGATLAVASGHGHSSSQSLQVAITGDEAAHATLDHAFAATLTIASVWVATEGGPTGSAQLLAVYMQPAVYQGHPGVTRILVVAESGGISPAVQFVPDDQSSNNLATTTFEQGPVAPWTLNQYVELGLTVDCTAGVVTLTVGNRVANVAIGDLPHVMTSELHLGIDYADENAGPFTVWYDDVDVR